MVHVVVVAAGPTICRSTGATAGVYRVPGGEAAAEMNTEVVVVRKALADTRLTLSWVEAGAAAAAARCIVTAAVSVRMVDNLTRSRLFLYCEKKSNYWLSIVQVH